MVTPLVPGSAASPDAAAAGRAGLLSLLLVLLLGACGPSGRFLTPTAETEQPPPDSTRAYTVFLIGDAGKPVPEGQEPTLRLLQSHMQAAGDRAAVVFLGDNIYPSGMPPASDPYRPEAERRIDAQLAAVRDVAGRVVFVPGNHDWGGLGLGGNRAALRRQEQYVEAALNRGNTFLPDRGFPGPAAVPLSDSLLLVVIDTQWWMEDDKPYGDTGQYQLEQEGEFLLELDDLLRRHAGKQIIVAAHHPLFTNGSHGGHFPGLKSLFTMELLSRRYLGTPQDLSNYKYRRLRENLLAIFERHPNLIYAAGHEHALQYFPYHDQHYVVSGAGSKTSHVVEGYGAAFADPGKGFATVATYTDGSTWLSFWKPADDGAEGRLAYRRRLRGPTRPLVAYRPARPDTLRMPAGPPAATQQMPGTDVPTAPGRETEAEAPYRFRSDSTVVRAAGRRYAVSPLKRFFLGAHYRDVWKLPVEVPVIDLAETAGGLTPLKKGGGLQTTSLRLQGADGDQYVLRSIDKDPTATVPPYLQGTLAHDIVQDQISAMHPYAAFAIPRLAEAAGLYHTRPRLVVIPHDRRLGLYENLFGGMLALFETRPDEDQSDEARFGYAENVVGTPKLLEEIAEDNDDRVDERAFARARLFDMFIGDWDRHGDQWRWAEFEAGNRKTFRPVPRDRDFAFFKFDGFFARLARLSGHPQFRRFTHFDADYGDLYGLNYNGAALDRRFTASLTRQDWLDLADSLRAALTDDVIAAAIRDLPPAVYDLHGPTLIRKLQGRRDRLPEAAAGYYDLLARVVDVVGSDKHERFEVIRHPDGRTELALFKTKKEGDIDSLLFRRTFLPEETDELRLYGLGGRDTFVLRGRARTGLLVRALGGEEEDTYIDSSAVDGPSEQSHFYDRPAGNHWQVGDEAEVITSADPAAFAYSMQRIPVTLTTPRLKLGHNADDGLLVGGGVRIVQPGFLARPYAAAHTLTATVATRRRALNVFYDGHFTGLYGPWDGRVRLDALAERAYDHFYGFGNETDPGDRDAYRARLGQVTVAPALQRSYWPFITARVGPRFQFTRVDPTDDPTYRALSRFTADDLVDTYYAGLDAAFEIDGTDTLANKRDGIRWVSRAGGYLGLHDTGASFARLSSELTYYYTRYIPSRLTLALRAGGATNIGRFPFYEANTLGGRTNLRGFRHTRFAGRSSVYTNVEMRLRLFHFNAYLTRGDVGVFAFLDNGRVWADEADSGVWHQGYGGGLWMSPFYRVIVTGTLARSSESTLFDVSLGFLF